MISAILMLFIAFAQPAFEVASIKPAPPPADGRMRMSLGGDPGRINYTNVNLKIVLPKAFEVKSYQISGPSWLDTERFNILATFPANTPKEQVPLMLQSLLVERFKLKFHREKKDLPVYALVVGKNGPKLQKAEEGGAGGDKPMMMMRPGRMEAKKMSMSNFVDMLSNLVDRPVVDMTGLPGFYDVTLDISMEEMAGMRGGMMRAMGPPPGDAGPAPEGAPAPSIFSSIQQLGLKLEPRKAPLDLIVIDSGDKVPTEN